MSWLKSKIKLVAARASDALAQAADLVAPTLYESRVDEFHHRWATVSRFLESIMTRDVDAHEQRRLLLDSHTRDSLQKLVLLLYAEENDTDRKEMTQRDAQGNLLDAETAAQQDHTQQHQTTRACLEYLLERQIIAHLCDVGRRDQPCGIMSLSMQFVTALLSRINYPLLPTREVHVSVIALIQSATKREVEDPVVRKCLINLLNVLWKKLRCDPIQTEFFFLHADKSKKGDVSDLVLFTGLLPHMYSPGKAGEKCREALVIAAGIHEPALCRFIMTLTPFCHYAVNGVITAYDALPKALPDSITARAGSTGSSSLTMTSSASTRGRLEQELDGLAMRLRFCCTLAMVGQFELDADEIDGSKTPGPLSITHEILTQFRSRFLEGPLLEALMDTSEATAQTATLYARIILEELASCCPNTTANPLLLVYLRFLLQVQDTHPHDAAVMPATGPTTHERRLPIELMHRMDSLSSSLSIATMDLYSSLLELQDGFVDNTLLGEIAPEVAAHSRRSSFAATLSPRSQVNGAIWLASRFPDSAVAANAHIWKIQAFDPLASDVEIPVSASPTDSDASEDQILSLLSYIADAEYVTCKRAPAVVEDWESEDEDDDESDKLSDPIKDDVASEPDRDAQQHRPRRDSAEGTSSTSRRTAATRKSMKPLKEIVLTISIPSYSPVATKVGRFVAGNNVAPQPSTELPLFVRLVLNRLERVLESSFYENLALSGLLSALAQKPRCSNIVFDTSEQAGHSVRAVLEDVYTDAVRRTSRLVNGPQRLLEIRRKLVDENNEMSLNDHEAETRLLCGFVMLDEILKELCSILFARERAKSLPVKPEGYYMEPRRGTLTSVPRVLSMDNMQSAVALGAGGSSAVVDSSGSASSMSSPPMSIGQEFEQMIADAESTMGSLLVTTTTEASQVEDVVAP